MLRRLLALIHQTLSGLSQDILVSEGHTGDLACMVTFSVHLLPWALTGRRAEAASEEYNFRNSTKWSKS